MFSNHDFGLLTLSMQSFDRGFLYICIPSKSIECLKKVFYF